MKRAAALVVLALTAACASGRGARCSPSMLLDRVEGQVVYTACAVDRAASSSGAVTTAVVFQPSSEQSCYRASVDVIVGPDGQPLVHTARIVSTNDGAYAEAILGMVREARYRPPMKNGVAVHQLARFERMQPARFTAGGMAPGCGT